MDVLYAIVATLIFCILGFGTWVKWRESYSAHVALSDCNTALGECKAVLTEMRDDGQRREERILSEIRLIRDDGLGRGSRVNLPVYIFSGTAPNKIFDVDGASIRRWGFQVFHDMDCNVQSLRDTLNYLRREKIEAIIHFACHGDEVALNLNGTIDAISLAEMLDRVETPLVILGACDSFGIGRRLKAPGRTIISMINKVESRDIEIFSDVLYEQIAAGKAIADAIDAALDKSPTALNEGVQVIRA